MANTAYMYEDENGDIIFTSKLKGSNPNREKHPAVRCPNCDRFIFSVLNKDVKNNMLCFDVDDPAYINYPRHHVRLCRRCHHRIGVLFLTTELRKMLERLSGICAIKT